MRDRHPSEQEAWCDAWFSELWPALSCHPKARLAYPEPKTIAAAGALYADLLADLPLELVRPAVRECLATCEWFPTPAELRAAADRLDATRVPTALEGWAEVLAAFECSYKPYQWRNLLARRVCEAMGGVYLLRMSERPGADRTEYLRRYDEMAARERTLNRLAPGDRRALEALAGPAGLLGDGTARTKDLPTRPPLPGERPLSRDEAAVMLSELIAKAEWTAPPPGPVPIARRPLEVVRRVETPEPSEQCSACGLFFPRSRGGCPRCELHEGMLAEEPAPDGAA